MKKLLMLIALVWSFASGQITTLPSTSGGGGGGGGATAFQDLTNFEPSNTSTVLTIPAGLYVFGGVTRNVTTTGTVTLGASSAASGSVLWVEADADGALYVTTNTNVTQANVTVANITKGGAAATGFTPGRIPLVSCTAGTVADQYATCTDARTPFTGVKLNAGTGISIASQSDGGNTISATASGNPQVLKTVINGTASCPSGYTSFQSYTLPSFADGDMVEVVAVLERTGSAATINGDISFDGNSITGGSSGLGASWTMLTSTPVWFMRFTVQRTSSTSFTSTITTDRGLAVTSGGSSSGGARGGLGASYGTYSSGYSSFSSTPVIAITADCSGADTIRARSFTVTKYTATP